MSQDSVTYCGGLIFDGTSLQGGWAAQFEGGILQALGPKGEIDLSGQVIDLKDDILSPGYVDLQLNGGDGLMLNDDPSVATLKRMAKAHRGLGCRRILPTLITDTYDKTRRAIDASVAAQGVPGIAGLHLEGPHLSVARKGAHDADLIRVMEDRDLEMLLQAAADLPALMLTFAPENVTIEQVKVLAEAGVVLSLGHTDADFDTALSYVEAGVGCATHLFNAMSQMGNRAPGVVGAVLASGRLSAGLIADGIHVHPQVMGAALRAKTGPAEIFLVSDAMAVAGTEDAGFALEGRQILRQNGRLTLEDGTLAGADLDLTRALQVLVAEVDVLPEQALRMATTVPARLIGLDMALRPGMARADVIRISNGFGAVSAA